MNTVALTVTSAADGMPTRHSNGLFGWDVFTYHQPAS
jgi:hypothetical protein